MKFNGHNTRISSQARIGQHVRIGDHAVIYPGVEIEDNVTICNDCVVGEPLTPYYGDGRYQNPATCIGGGSLIRSHSIIYAGCRLGAELCTGHRVTVRENTTIGEHCALGTMTDIQGNVLIGKYCRLHSNVHIAQTCSLADFVFMYPFSVMTNDPWPPSLDWHGGHIASFTQVGVHAVILPGVHVGENCLLGANTVVTKNVPSHSLVMGDPARVVMDVRAYRALGKGHPYPWMYRYDRGMPWEGMGYEAWMARRSANGASA